VSPHGELRYSGAHFYPSLWIGAATGSTSAPPPGAHPSFLRRRASNQVLATLVTEFQRRQEEKGKSSTGTTPGITSCRRGSSAVSPESFLPHLPPPSSSAASGTAARRPEEEISPFFNATESKDLLGGTTCDSATSVCGAGGCIENSDGVTCVLSAEPRGAAPVIAAILQ